MSRNLLICKGALLLESFLILKLGASDKQTAVNIWHLSDVEKSMLRPSVSLYLAAIFFPVLLNAKDTFSPYTSADQVPRSAASLWDSYDSRAEALNPKIHHEWKEGGVVSRLVTFKVGTFKGSDARIAAYYCFPDNGKKNPAFVWSHGGGQRADRKRGRYFATQGFASIDINWLGRPLEPELDPENKWGTDWGKVDPSQGLRFYPRALRKSWKRSLEPDDYTIDSVASPRNANWFLLAVAARRAISFLEEQPEVDPGRLGFTGFSMGGTITSMTASDPRLKAVAPIVGGTGFLHIDFPGIPRSSIGTHFKNPELYQTTIDPSAYWPLVKCPVMFITSSNDFHSAFQRIYRSMDLLPHEEWRVTGNMHANHGPGPGQWVLLNHWFKKHLVGEKKNIPVMPPSEFIIEEGSARISVTPEDQERLKEVEIYYSYDPNCVTRFWKRAPSTRDGNTWQARIKIHAQLPLYTFALCRYQLARPELLERGNEASTFTLNSRLHSHIPEDINLTAFAQLPKTGLVDDFANGISNWSSRDQFSIRTYKLQDPELNTASDRKLTLTFNLEQDKPLLLGLGVESKFLGNGRDLGSFNHGRRITGDGPTTVTLSPADFNNKDGKELEWSRITTFTITLTDPETKQKIKLTDPDAGKILQRIELVEDEEKKAEDEAAQRERIYLYMEGRKVFMKSCVQCHGARGKGDGSWADGWVTNRPRNFRSGVFKFRTTPMGKLPTREDLKRTIAKGISGTAMPAFEKNLRDHEYDAVIEYIKSFSRRWKDPENQGKPVDLPKKAPDWLNDNQRVQAGKVLFQTHCVACHGATGKGDGAGAKGLKDLWEFPIHPADLSKGTFKSGDQSLDLFRTISTGLDGTPMAGFGSALTAKQIWELIAYIQGPLAGEDSSTDSQ